MTQSTGAYHGGSGKTDADGRYFFAGFAPEVEGWLESGSSNRFVDVESRRHRSGIGEVFPEETIVVFWQSGVRGSVRTADGAPFAEGKIRIDVHYGADRTQRLVARTDTRGIFTLRAGVPATNVRVVVTGQQGAESVKWTSRPVKITAGQVTNLGTIVLQGASADSE